MPKRSANYDQRCLELAQVFLLDEPKLMSKSFELASLIQSTIEDWIKYERAVEE